MDYLAIAERIGIPAAMFVLLLVLLAKIGRWFDARFLDEKGIVPRAIDRFCSTQEETRDAVRDQAEASRNMAKALESQAGSLDNQLEVLNQIKVTLEKEPAQ